MARRKKQKNRKKEVAATSGPTSVVASGQTGRVGDLPSDNTEQELSEASLEPKRTPIPRQGQPKKVSRPGIRPATAIGGMILTFILGAYIGTLLPQIMRSVPEHQDTQKMPQPGKESPKPAAMENTLDHVIEKLEARVKGSPDNAEVLIELGNAYFDAGRPPLAIDAYEKALKITPDNANVLTDLGIMYRETNNFQKALECFRKAQTIQPGHQNAIYNEGVVLVMDLDDKTEGVEAWKRLLDLNPQARAPDGRPLADVIKNIK